MAALGRIESKIDKLATDIALHLVSNDRVSQDQHGAILEWMAAQDARIKPITDLLGELAEAEQAPDQPELDGQQAAIDEIHAQADHELAEAHRRAGNEAAYPQVTGSLWRNIAAPEPDPERMAQLGDPRLVEDEPG